MFIALDSEPDKPIAVSGVVKEVQFTNPNVWITVETKTRTYKIKGKSPNSLVNLGGWTEDALKAGDRVNVEGFLIDSDDPSIIGFATLTLPESGRRLYAGSSIYP